MDYKIGQVVQMKKPHPCGVNQFEILRVGMDFRIKCVGCGHLAMLSRIKFEKSAKKIISDVEEEQK